MRARREGRALGGCRPATEERNQEAHQAALLRAPAFGVTLEAGCEKSLAELSRDLFSAGCKTRSGGCWTPEMVRRLRVRLKETKLALADVALEVGACA
jgi:hypothetical protein